ncbi:LPP20 family lipoprotein [Sphingosinicella microcystinivorans]|uniref:LPP20 family lipoprotein n=1 Tax=Sphingosinicella microcystinivorans TaxID=335406 RepID=UPI0022F3C387|nr:LPP20 family lipoprotein [Sphingosinicella microcystinivorans]WBX82371.1 LPP20 family lipoprotein [Sphingosinicella microcystinivorans]
MTSRSVLAALALFALPARAQEAVPAVLTGVGFAPISSQPAKTDEERRLLAIRASHLAALRNLAEQVYGVKLQSQSSAANTSLQSDSIRATVSGTVAGARIVKITPKGDDTYETIVEMKRPAGGAD